MKLVVKHFRGSSINYRYEAEYILIAYAVYPFKQHCNDSRVSSAPQVCHNIVQGSPEYVTKQMHNIIIVVHTLKSSHMLHEGFQVCCKVVVFAKYHNTQKLPKLAKCETYVAVTGISYEPVTTKAMVNFRAKGAVTPDKKFGIMLILWPISHAHTYPSRFNSLCQHYDCIQFVLPNHPPEV